jgi:hypothetical protein
MINVARSRGVTVERYLGGKSDRLKKDDFLRYYFGSNRDRLQ